MAHTVDVEGYGSIDFPDNMSDEQIKSVLQNHFGKNQGLSGIGSDIKNTLSQIPSELLSGLSTAAKGAPGALEQFLAPPGTDDSSRFIKNILAGFSNMGRGIANTPHNITQTLSGKGLISPQHVISTLINPNENYSKDLGINNPSESDALIQGISQYLPAVLAGGETLPGQTASATAFGATQSKNPIEGAISGMALGSGAGAVHSLLQSAKTIPNVLKTISPKSVMNEVLKNIPQKSSEEYLKASGMYNEAFKDYANNKIQKPNLNEDIFSHPRLNSLYEEYNKNPTINNAHKLQSEEARLIGDDYASDEKRAYYSDARGKLIKAIKKGLDNSSSLNNEAMLPSDLYDLASHQYYNNYIPYKMLQNSIKEMVPKTPQKIANAIEKTTLKKGFPSYSSQTVEIPQIPDEIQSYMKNLNASLRNKALLKKLGIGGLTLGLANQGYHGIKNIFEGGQ